jgi:SAM-dependent methyltransferase
MSLKNKIVYALKHPDYLMRRMVSAVVDPVRRAGNFNYGQWARVVMYRELFEYVRGLQPEKLSMLEISPGEEGQNSPWRKLGFGRYESFDYPEFDICKDRLDREFDVIVADQVFEHLLWPYRAARNVYAMLKPGGRFINTTPFLVPVHHVPVDCSRWTELGMKHFLAEAGFELERVRTGSWGNLECVRANLTHLGVHAGWHRQFVNEPDFPIVVWAIAEK